MSVLVAYATRRGSTREVAEAVAGTLYGLGAEVELQEARRVPGHADYMRSQAGLVRGEADQVQVHARRWSFVVLGAPLYSGRWHRDAHRFLRRHRAELAGVPVAVFGMGPREADREAWQRSREQLDRALAKHPWLTPTAVTVFGGADPPGRRPRRDLRDWAQIDSWAASIANPVAWLKDMARVGGSPWRDRPFQAGGAPSAG